MMKNCYQVIFYLLIDYLLVINFNNGNKYDGAAVDGVPEGNGTLILKNGDKFEGQFVDGKYNGFGRLTFAENGDYYIGNFKDGLFHGLGNRLGLLLI